MNIILLSGGSGKRLWPLSNDVRSKQFLKIFRNSEGGLDSMLQSFVKNIRKIDENANITIATSQSQLPSIHNQLKDDVNISVEPARRDTFPAIALAAMYLKDVLNVGMESPVVVCPVDPYVDEDYFKALSKLSKLSEEGDHALTLMGIEPREPSEKYGYIIPENIEDISPVREFREKPGIKEAEEYISRGALWNGGIFAFKLGYLVDKAHEIMSFTDYADLYKRFHEMEKISFDYAVCEKEKNIQVMRFSGRWEDIGTWDSFCKAMSDSSTGDCLLEKCENVNVLNELDLPVLCMGLHDMIVSLSPQGILVSDREESRNIKPFVDRMDSRVMFAEKSWGVFHVLDVEENSMTIKVTMKAGDHMNYHSHERRDEVWTIVSGEGRTIVDGMEQKVRKGDVITMQAGCRHVIFAVTDLVLIEVQIGKNIQNSDKRKFPLPGEL